MTTPEPFAQRCIDEALRQLPIADPLIFGAVATCDHCGHFHDGHGWMSVTFPTEVTKAYTAHCRNCGATASWDWRLV